MGEGSNLGSTQKMGGWPIANRCFFCCVEEEFINHILIHCTKATVLYVGRRLFTPYMLWVGLLAPFSLLIYKIFCAFNYQK